jgi:hypothetical protein
MPDQNQNNTKISNKPTHDLDFSAIQDRDADNLKNRTRLAWLGDVDTRAHCQLPVVKHKKIKSLGAFSRL